MSKLGVGVGEDFPVDDENGNGGPGSQGGPGPQGEPGARSETPGARSETDERADYEDWKHRRDAHRAAREAWRADREEWRARKRAFKRKFKEAIHDSFGDSRNWHEGEFRGGGRYYNWRPRFWPLGAFGMSIAALVLLVPILLLVLFFSLITAAFKAPFLILAIFLVGFLVFGMGHRHHGYDRGRRYYYDSDIETPPRPRPQQPRSPQSGTIITPPPAAGK